ncbi:EamA family transporter [Sphingobacterium lactis]|uniref:Permease of the drug/metabolite transporter (DMT) superfamily n=1 Tax=Sphingobacterium lactis TaxID=797291 RepID=A0A1H5TZY1_9SPHI|nr:EamA family transporter [Sphingobacterium lactis]SEF68300.1 Permease of the drug/metabolite transporter (DMT) superfamily [Sphingobacterium lactis]
MVKSANPAASTVIFAYLVVYIVWGSTFFFIEKALHAFPPFVLGSIRFIIAGTLLMGYCWLKGYKLYIKKPVRDAATVGFLLLFVDMAAIIWSEQYISSAIVSILSAATAIWFIILDKPKWKENFSSIPTLLGLILGFLGVVMLFAEQIFGAEAAGANSDKKLTAMIVMTLGTIGWTVGSLISKYSKNSDKKKAEEETAQPKEEEDLNVMVKTAWQMVVAGTTFTLVALLNGEYKTFDFQAVPTEYWGAMIYLALMGSILAFSCYIYLLQVRPATEVSTYAYVNPIVALILVHFFTDHIVSRMQIIGLAVVLFSVLLMNWNLYRNSDLVKNYKRRRKIKKLRDMAPKSSIPRIVEVAEFGKKKEKKSKEDKNPETEQ